MCILGGKGPSILLCAVINVLPVNCVFLLENDTEMCDFYGLPSTPFLIFTPVSWFIFLLFMLLLGPWCSPHGNANSRCLMIVEFNPMG